MVENGVFKYPVSEITIAGNFNDMFKNITLADDLEFKYSTNAPTMLIEGMVVAGKWKISVLLVRAFLALQLPIFLAKNIH